jgi:hypothetical protein
MILCKSTAMSLHARCGRPSSRRRRRRHTQTRPSACLLPPQGKATSGVAPPNTRDGAPPSAGAKAPRHASTRACGSQRRCRCLRPSSTLHPGRCSSEHVAAALLGPRPAAVPSAFNPCRMIDGGALAAGTSRQATHDRQRNSALRRAARRPSATDGTSQAVDSVCKSVDLFPSRWLRG